MDTLPNAVARRCDASRGAAGGATALRSTANGCRNWSRWNVRSFESLANLAHELRTPVQVLLGYLDILRDEAAVAGDAPLEPDRIDDHRTDERQRARTRADGRECSRICARACAGADTAIEEEIELAEFFAELEEILTASNRNRSSPLRSIFEHAPRPSSRDAGRCDRSCLNLASNAIKFTEEGASHNRCQPRYWKRR